MAVSYNLAVGQSAPAHVPTRPGAFALQPGVSAPQSLTITATRGQLVCSELPPYALCLGGWEREGGLRGQDGWAEWVTQGRVHREEHHCVAACPTALPCRHRPGMGTAVGRRWRCSDLKTGKKRGKNR